MMDRSLVQGSPSNTCIQYLEYQKKGRPWTAVVCRVMQGEETAKDKEGNVREVGGVSAGTEENYERQSLYPIDQPKNEPN